MKNYTFYTKMTARVLLVALLFQAFGGVSLSQASVDARPTVDFQNYEAYVPENPIFPVTIGKIVGGNDVSYALYIWKWQKMPVNDTKSDRDPTALCILPTEEEKKSVIINQNNEIVVQKKIDTDSDRYTENAPSLYFAIKATDSAGRSNFKVFGIYKSIITENDGHKHTEKGWYYDKYHYHYRLWRIDYDYQFNDCFMQMVDIPWTEKVIVPNRSADYDNSPRYIKWADLLNSSTNADGTRISRFRKTIYRWENVDLTNFNIIKAVESPAYFDLAGVINKEKDVDITLNNTKVNWNTAKNYNFWNPWTYTVQYKSPYFLAQAFGEHYHDGNIGYGGFNTINEYEIRVKTHDPKLKTNCATVKKENGKFLIANLEAIDVDTDETHTFELSQADIDAGYSIVGNKLYRDKKVDERELTITVKDSNYAVHETKYTPAPPTYTAYVDIPGQKKKQEISGYLEQDGWTGTKYSPIYDCRDRFVGYDSNGDGRVDADYWYPESMAIYKQNCNTRTDIPKLYSDYKKTVSEEGYTEWYSQEKVKINEVCPVVAEPKVFTGTGTFTATGEFTRNNCDAGFAGGVVNVSKSATATATGTTQKEADKKALEKATKEAKKLLADEGQNFANANGTCTQVVFSGSGSFTATGTVQKNDCKDKEIGSQVEVSVTKSATATGSTQEEADKKALAEAEKLAKTEFENTKQTEANKNGACSQVIFDGTGEFTKTGSFVKNDCGTGKTGNAIEFSKTKKVTATGSSQNEANKLALAEAKKLVELNFDTEGQNFANEKWTCTQTVFEATKEFTVTGTFTCSNGATGSGEYTATASSSATGSSQEDADKKALAAAKKLAEKKVADEGQTAVNASKTCEKKPKPKPVAKMTKWMDENGVEIKTSETGKTFADAGNIDGYEFVKEEVNGDEKVYIFKKKKIESKPVIKTTKWVDENGNEIKSSETGKEFGKAENIDGYILKEAKENGNVKTYIFEKKKPKPKPVTKTTKWLDENGVEIKKSATGENFGKKWNLEGYVFLDEKISENEKVYIFKKKAVVSKAKTKPKSTSGHGGGYNPKLKPTAPKKGTVLQEVWNTTLAINTSSEVKGTIFNTQCSSLIKNLDDMKMKALYYKFGINNSSDEFVRQSISFGQFSRVLNKYERLLKKLPAKDKNINSILSTIELNAKNKVERRIAAKVFIEYLKGRYGSEIFTQMQGQGRKKSRSFADVNYKGDKFAPNIQNAYNLCLLHGRKTRDGMPEDGSNVRVFEPTSYITIAETVKVLVNMGNSWDGMKW